MDYSHYSDLTIKHVICSMKYSEFMRCVRHLKRQK